ncbi:MAG: hypothetical protein HY518_04545 [Candidatus Aenigmarchaeota archaeon]|nr:hypothetical protein [Candidatus Aenigmarchaeota archaeon]
MKERKSRTKDVDIRALKTRDVDAHFSMRYHTKDGADRDSKGHFGYAVRITRGGSRIVGLLDFDLDYAPYVKDNEEIVRFVAGDSVEVFRAYESGRTELAGRYKIE